MNWVKTISESYTKQALFEQWANSNTSSIVEAICRYEEAHDVELTEKEIAVVLESVLTESYK